GMVPLYIPHISLNTRNPRRDRRIRKIRSPVEILPGVTILPQWTAIILYIRASDPQLVQVKARTGIMPDTRFLTSILRRPHTNMLEPRDRTTTYVTGGDTRTGFTSILQISA